MKPAVILILCNMSLLLAADFYVDAQSNGDGSMAAPFSSIQPAIEAATNGDRIMVAQGTYPGNIAIVEKNLTLLGGYGPAFDSRDPEQFSCLIQGDGQDATVTLLEAGDTVIDGFRITGGTRSLVDLPFFKNGGGVYCSGGAPIVRNNLIEGNNSYHPDNPEIDEVDGGGIYASDSSIQIIGNLIRHNVSGRGGGIAVNGGSDILIEGNQVIENQALSDHGGGLYLSAESIRVSNNFIAGNELGLELGYGWGGGAILFDAGSYGEFSGNTYTDNLAHSIGSGFFVDDGATAILHHELFINNRSTECQGQVYVDGLEDPPGTLIPSSLTMWNCTVADGCGNGIRVEQGSTATIRNTIIWGQPGDPFSTDPSSSYEASYCLSDPAAPGTGNLAADPLFATDNDFHLRSTAGRWADDGSGNGVWVSDSMTSPAIDAGDPEDSWSFESMPHGSRVNMGVYGNTVEASRSGQGSPPVGQTSNRVIVHLTTQGGGFETDLLIENPTALQQTFRIWPYDASGHPLSEYTGSINAKSIIRLAATALSVEPAAYLFVDPESEVRVYAVYQSSFGEGSPAHLQESSASSNRWRFYVGDWDHVFDGLAIVNRGPLPAQGTLNQIRDDGTLVQSISAFDDLAPLAKSLLVVGSPTQQNFVNPQQGYFELESSQPLHVTALRGSPPSAQEHYLWSNPAYPID